MEQENRKNIGNKHKTAVDKTTAKKTKINKNNETKIHPAAKNFHVAKWHIQKNTIGYKMTTLIVAIMALSMLAAGIFSSVFLQKYYTNKKQNSIKAVYESLKEIAENDPDIENADNVTELDTICEKSGATLVMVNSSGNAVYDYGAGNMLVDRWRDMIFGQNIGQMEKPKVIEKTDKYTLQNTVDKFSSNQYYELYGTLSSGNYIIIRMSVESFKESISISNKFYLGLGIALIIVTTLIIIFVTRKFTDPILQLADISKKMSNLDFNAKYTGNYDNEIGVLGESMNDMSKKLERTISELKSANIELHKDIARKEEVDEMRKEFISNVSHELKTPIALIQGYAEGLQEGINDNPEDMQYYCDVIVDEAGKMNKMVKNLLALNQLEFGNTQVNMERFNIDSVVLGVINSMKLRAEQEHVQIEFVCQKSLSVWADEFQIEEVITNYLSNAFNHVDKNKLIKVEITEKNGIVRVSVFNTGKQIPDKEIENIWIKFYKVDKARTRAYGGNGIGLSIVKAIMDRHNKKCGVINHDDGVEFWFELDADSRERD